MSNHNRQRRFHQVHHHLRALPISPPQPMEAIEQAAPVSVTTRHIRPRGPMPVDDNQPMVDAVLSRYDE
jgi:hypothetical protein